MKTIEILEKRKKEVVEATLPLLSEAFNCSGMFKPNVEFMLNEDESGEIKVRYHYFAGNINHSDDVFMIVLGQDLPIAEDLGYDHLEEVDWNNTEWPDVIDSKIEQHIAEYYLLQE